MLCPFEIAAGPRALYEAWTQVRRNRGAPGVDGITISDVERNAERMVSGLSRDLFSGSYIPSSLRRVRIPKSKSGEWRVLGIPTVMDRIVQHSVVKVLHCLWEPRFSSVSFAYRPGSGTDDAIALARRYLRDRYVWCLRGDIRGCFDELNWDRLSLMLSKNLVDDRLRGVINKSIRVSFIDKNREIRRKKGVPQGAPLSPVLSNLYLHPFDMAMLRKGAGLVRYADDWLVFCGDREEARFFQGLSRQFLACLGIRENPVKSGIFDLERQEVTFLGHRLSSSRIGASSRAWERAYRAAETLRNGGASDDRCKARSELLSIRSQYRNVGRL